MEQIFTLTTMKPWRQTMNVKHACKCVKSITTSLQCCNLDEENVNLAPLESFLHPVDSWGGAHGAEQTLVASAGPCMKRSALSGGDILAGTDLRLLYEFVKKRYWRQPQKCWQDTDKDEDSGGGQRGGLAGREQPHLLLSYLSFRSPITQSSGWRRKWSQNVQRQDETPSIFKILVGLWAERYCGPQRAYPCIIYLIGGIEQTCRPCKFVFFLWQHCPQQLVIIRALECCETPSVIKSWPAAMLWK